jgi:hypothetical protein
MPSAIVSDGNVAIIGTINMDYRTFYLNFENGVAFYLLHRHQRWKRMCAGR